VPLVSIGHIPMVSQPMEVPMRPNLLRVVLVGGVLLAGSMGTSAFDGTNRVDLPELERRLVRGDRDLTNAEFTILKGRLIGTTANAVIVLMGKPDSIGCGPDGRLRWCYCFGKAGTVSFHFENGTVRSIGRDERQTGVRDDDFVGLVGP
jgi:hypothetical protein